jgi:16S rRNA (cytidine1402-2'-O)-methyltransferase
MATLYLVSTPIGNLGDVTDRARSVLGAVDRILAEDTRRTRKLLKHLGLRTSMTSLHAHNERQRTNRILEWLSAGEELALVSDAGTPLVSDPGTHMVEEVVNAGHEVVPIPGPSAVLAALVASGIPFHRFTFLGFLPRKGRERRALLSRVAASPETTILFESPERVRALLTDLVAECGGERRAAAAREITKLHEEFVRGTLDDLLGAFGSRPPRGEITVVVSGVEGRSAAPTTDDADGAEREATTLGATLLAEGMSPSRVAKELTGRVGLPRNRAYGLVQELAAHRKKAHGKDPLGPSGEGESNP